MIIMSKENNKDMQIALNIFRNEIHDFLQRCMLQAGFENAHTEECRPSYMHFMSILLSMRFGSSARCQEKPSKKTKLNQYIANDVDESKIISSLMEFSKTYEAFLSSIVTKSHKENEENFLTELRCLAFEEEMKRFEKLVQNSSNLKSEPSPYLPNEKTNPHATESTDSFNMMRQQKSVSSLRFKTNNFSIYHTIRSGKEVLIKVINKEFVSEQDKIEKLDNELEVIKDVSHHGTRKSLQRTTFEGRQALIVEWIQGETIKDIGKFHIKDFLQIVREIVSGLVALHSSNVIHNSITTDHIIVNKHKNSAILIGFSNSFAYGSHSDFFAKSDYPSNNINLIAPEKTIQTANKIDFRSDFYSLGIVFYYMLVGFLPFQVNNQAKNCIISHQTLLEVDKKLPIAISNMVNKLLAKRADDRYQSAKGILL